MALQFDWYEPFAEYWARGDSIFKDHTFRAGLVTSAYTFSAAHATVADITNELSGNGYARVALSGVNVTRSDNVATVDFADIEFPTVTTAAWTFRRLFIFNDSMTSPVADALVCSILFDDTPDDVVVNPGIQFIAKIPSGLATLTL